MVSTGIFSMISPFRMRIIAPRSLNKLFQNVAKLLNLGVFMPEIGFLYLSLV
jgi:hypothetical protein